MKCAYAIVHFGSNIKYLEYEMYTILMLQSISKQHDIVYLYNANDTPEIYAKTMKKMGVKVKPYNDEIISKSADAFKSTYTHFNILKVCNFIYAYLLEEYDRVCVVESDMIFLDGFEKVFDLQCPAILYLGHNETKIYDNNRLYLDKGRLIRDCPTDSYANGGIMLLEPSKVMFSKCVESFDAIVKNGCKFPNETLFLVVNEKLYSLPLEFNYSHYRKDRGEKAYNYHFHHSIFKPLDVIKDGYIDKMNRNENIKNVVKEFKAKYYDKYNENITNILSKIMILQEVKL